MRDKRSIGGFGAGLLVGLLLGSSGIASASFGYKLWSTLTLQYKTGYLNGFLDMLNLARNLQPGGWLDTKYPFVPQARPVEWRDMVDELYKDPANHQYQMTSLLQVAAKRLEDKYGKASSPEQRAQDRLKHQLAILRKNQEKMGIKPDVPHPDEVPSTPKVVAAGEHALMPGDVPEEKPHRRKRCRCEGDAAESGDAAKAGDAKKAGDADKKGDAAKASGPGKPGEAAAKSDAAKKTEPAAGKAADGAKGGKEAAAKPAASAGSAKTVAADKPAEGAKAAPAVKPESAAKP